MLQTAHSTYAPIAQSSSSLQEERFSPLRSVANAVPQEGVPKYDFLRDLLRSAAQPRDTTPSSQALASSSSSDSGAGWTLPPSLDPLAALLQDAKQPWRAPDSKYDPFNALSRALADPEEPTGSVAALDPLGNLLKADQASTAAIGQSMLRHTLEVTFLCNLLV